MDIFKSQFNAEIEAKKAKALAPESQKKSFEVNSSPPITIEGNRSVSAPISFEEAFSSAPFVLYSVVCSDRNFALSHYITDIKATHFVICIENQSLEARHVVIQYEARLK